MVPYLKTYYPLVEITFINDHFVYITPNTISVEKSPYTLTYYLKSSDLKINVEGNVSKIEGSISLYRNNSDQNNFSKTRDTFVSSVLFSDTSSLSSMSFIETNQL